MSLQDRKEAFSLLASRFENTKVSDLLLEHKIPNSLKKWLHSSVFIYVSKCLPGDELYLDENSLMNALVENYDKDKIPNMTPNGMLVPKKYPYQKDSYQRWLSLLSQSFVPLFGSV